MPPQLVSLTEGPSILLDKPILLLGRHPECDVQIESRKISRRHCCIAQVGDYLIIRDLGSTNGVRINGVRITEGRLGEGDELTIGTLRYQVSWQAAEDVPPRRRAAAPPAKPPLPEDDALESADEPVPLPDPNGRPVLPPELPLDLLGGSIGVAHRTEDAPPGSLILPENLELRPPSGERSPLPMPPAKSGSHSGSHSHPPA